MGGGDEWRAECRKKARGLQSPVSSLQKPHGFLVEVLRETAVASGAKAKHQRKRTLCKMHNSNLSSATLCSKQA